MSHDRDFKLKPHQAKQIKDAHDRLVWHLEKTNSLTIKLMDLLIENNQLSSAGRLCDMHSLLRVLTGIITREIDS